jgi:hypothetical protein
MKPDIRFIHEAVKVKNAKLLFDYETRTYHLIHYDTEILTIKYHSADIRSVEITKCLKCSNSSTRAIYQATDFLGIDRKYVNKCMVPFNGFYKEKMSTDRYVTSKEFKETIEN